jgi:predicted nuclease of predicted toxin-antitoxin system
MRILIDMNLSPRWLDQLRTASIEAVHWQALGAHDAADERLMDFARSHDYVVLTHDLDFSAILAATGGRKPSVVQIRADDIRPETIGASVVNALLALQSQLELGAIVTIEPGRARLRWLPLRS